MKYLFVCVVLISTYSTLNAQGELYGLPLKDGRIFLDTVVEIAGVSEDVLFTRSLKWGLEHFSSQKDANQINDRQGGIVAYTGYYEKPLTDVKVLASKVTDLRQVWYTIRFYIKDGKSRIIIDGVKIRSNVYGGYGQRSGTTDFWYIEDFEDQFKKLGKKYRPFVVANRIYFGELTTDLRGRMHQAAIALTAPKYDENW